MTYDSKIEMERWFWREADEQRSLRDRPLGPVVHLATPRRVHTVGEGVEVLLVMRGGNPL